MLSIWSGLDFGAARKDDKAMTTNAKSERSGQLDRLISLVANRPEAMIALARQYAAVGNAEQSIALTRQARDLLTNDCEAATIAAELLCEGVPAWHFRLLRDDLRNQAYDRALRRAVKPDSLVLEIGTGSGILAMMAARAGARVVTCEMNPSIAAAACSVIAANGLSDRITVINKPSFDLEVGVDLGRPADILVSEIVSNDLLNENVLAAHGDAVRRLLKPDAAVIPACGRIRFALAEHRHWDAVRVGMTSGFDLSKFNELARPFREVHPVEVSFRSDAQTLFEFDFASAGPLLDRRATHRAVSTGGVVNGILQWIAIDLDDGDTYENRPDDMPQSCWSPLFWRFSDSIDTVGGETFAVGGYHTEDRIRLWRQPL